MTENNYQLQPVLKIRERKLEECKRLFAASIIRLTQEQNRLTQLLKLHEILKSQIMWEHEHLFEVSKIHTHQQMKTNAARMRSLQEQEQRALKNIEEQKIVVDECQQVKEQSLQDMTQASSQLKVIEKHKEKWFKALVQKQAKIEDEINDEIAQTRFIAAKVEHNVTH